jgi:hypothetical protein
MTTSIKYSNTYLSDTSIKHSKTYFSDHLY